MSQLANELNLSNEELELYKDLFEFEKNTGQSGDGDYGYYTYIPEGIDNDVMKRNEWNVGDLIWLSHHAVED